MIVEELPAKADVVVVGAGIAGATTAYFLAKSGVDVLLIDRTGPAAEASSGNAGLIVEAWGDSSDALELLPKNTAIYREAAQAFPDDFELVLDGRLRIAMTPAEVTAIEAIVKRQSDGGLPAEMVYGADIQTVEPAVSTRALAAGFFPEEGKLHPGKTTVAFYNAAVAAGATAMSGVNATALLTSGNTVTGVQTDRGTVNASQVVISTGAWTPQLAATAGLAVPVFPGKGTMVRTEPLPPISTRVLRPEPVGTRQLADGSMLIGSQVVHDGYNKKPDAATVAFYVERMGEVIPAMAGAKVADSWGCLRPMSIDQRPIIGPVDGLGGLMLNTGHGQVGMCIGPAISKALVEQMLTGTAEYVDISHYAFSRFANV